MKKELFIIIGLFWTYPLFAQEIAIKLYAEQTDSSVMLAWVPEKWPSDLTGFIVKKRTGNQDWVELTSKVIEPYSSIKKDLSNVVSDQKEQQRLKAKFQGILDSGAGKEITAQEYRSKILKSTTLRQTITLMFALDYDLMLLNGFGFIDTNTSPGNDIIYGIFPKMNETLFDEPIARYKVNLTDLEPKLNMSSSVEILANREKIRLHWKFNLGKFRNAEYKGFNIYAMTKNDIPAKLNKNIIWITSNSDPADLNRLVLFPQQKTRYKAVPVTYFGTEKEGSLLEFDPSIYLITIPAPELNVVRKEESLQLKWQLDHRYDSLIRGIEIQLKNTDGEYSKLATLEAKKRDWAVPIPENGLSGMFKVVIKSKIDSEIWSNEKAVNIVPRARVAAPTDLTAEIIQESNKFFILLNWNYPENGAVEFRIFTDGPDGILIYNSAMKGEKISPYQIPVVRSIGTRKRFAIQAMASDRTKSMLSNSVELITPTITLPPLRILGVEQKNEGTQISWKFSNDIPDLNGFRILIDGVERLSKDQVESTKRAVIITGLSEGRHEVVIVAVTKYNVERSSGTPYIFRRR